MITRMFTGIRIIRPNQKTLKTTKEHISTNEPTSLPPLSKFDEEQYNSLILRLKK